MWELVNPLPYDRDNVVVNIMIKFEPTIHLPNGIESVNNLLLVSVLFNGDFILRLDLETGEQQEVHISPSDVYSSGDGLKFDRNKEVLYIARHNEDSIVALVSCDNWNSSVIATEFSTHCLASTGSEMVTTLALENSNIWVFCADNFGQGPYGLHRVLNASSLVYSGSMACPDQTVITPGGTDDDLESNYIYDPFFWSFIVASSIIIIGGIAFFILFKSSFFKKADTMNEILLPPL